LSDIAGSEIAGSEFGGSELAGSELAGSELAVGPAGPGRTLVLSADEELVDDLLRLASAAAVELVVVPEAGAARGTWGGAPLVLVGDDQAAAVIDVGLPRRRGVVVVGRSLDDPGIWQRAVSVGAEQVVFLPEAEGWLVDRLADSADVGATALVLCVVGGRGGGGATTLAAALAFAGLRRRMRTLLVDADPLGGGIDLVLGGEDAPGLRWPDLASARGRVAPSALSASLPEVDALTVLSWDRGDLLEVGADAISSVLTAGAKAADLVVVDLPRRTDPAAEVALAMADRCFLVLPAELRAIASAGRVASGIASLTQDLRVVVRGPAPSALDAEVVAQALGLPLAGRCRPEPGLASALERGDPPGRTRGPLATLADALLADVARSRSAPGA
jgi:secretion/DNA translocation related CpaE-like protein